MNTLLAFALCALVLGGVIWRVLGERLGQVELTQLFTLMMPLVLVYICFFASPSFGDLRLRFTGFEMDTGRAARPLRMGGDAEIDDLYDEYLPPGLVSIGLDAEGQFIARHGANVWAPAEPTAARPEANADVFGVIEFEREDGIKVIARSAPLPPSALLEAGGHRFRFAPDGSGLIAIESGAEPLPHLPLKRLFTPLGDFGRGWRPWAATSAIFPLRDYGLPRPPADTDLDRPCTARWLCVAGTELPLRSFIYQVAAGAGGWRVALLDPDARVIHRRAVLAEAGVPARPKAIRLYRVLPGTVYDDIASAETPPARLDRRITLEVERHGDAIRLVLAKPPTAVIRNDALTRKKGSPSSRIFVVDIGPATRAGGSGTSQLLPIEGVGGLSGTAIHGALRLTKKSGFGRTAKTFELSSLDRPVELGRPFALGSGDGIAVSLVLERFDRPWPLLVGVFSTIFLLWFAMRKVWAGHSLSLALVLVTVWLLAIRWLIGVESALLDPVLDQAQPVAAPALALALVPLLLALMTPGSEARGPLWPTLLAASLVGVSSWLLYLQVAGWREIPNDWMFFAGGIVVAALLLVTSRLAGFGVAFRTFAMSIWQWVAAWPWWLWVLLLIAARVGLWALGYRERLFVALSIVTIPPLILCFAAGLTRLRRNGSVRQHGLMLVMILAAYIGLPFLLGDSGLAIYAIPIGAVWLFVLFRQAPRSRWVFAILAFAVVAGFPAYERWIERSSTARLDRATTMIAQGGDRERANRIAAQVLAERTEGSRNDLRLWTTFASERVAASASNEGESQFRVSAILADYTASFAGRGWGKRSDPADIRPYQADDNLSAIHLMSPFGRLGAALLVAVLGLLAWRADQRLARNSRRGLAASIALWTLFSTAAYMILANLSVVPFTGRNIYLLSALSVSDLLEGALIVLIALRLGRWRAA